MKTLSTQRTLLGPVLCHTCAATVWLRVKDGVPMVRNRDGSKHACAA